MGGEEAEPGGGSRGKRRFVRLVRLREHVRKQGVGALEVGSESEGKLGIARLQFQPRECGDRLARLQVLG